MGRDVVTLMDDGTLRVGMHRANCPARSCARQYSPQSDVFASLRFVVVVKRIPAFHPGKSAVIKEKGPPQRTFSHTPAGLGLCEDSNPEPSDPTISDRKTRLIGTLVGMFGGLVGFPGIHSHSVIVLFHIAEDSCREVCETVSQAVHGIRAGRFTPNLKPELCEHCECGRICKHAKADF